MGVVMLKAELLTLIIMGQAKEAAGMKII